MSETPLYVVTAAAATRSMKTANRLRFLAFAALGAAAVAALAHAFAPAVPSLLTYVALAFWAINAAAGAVVAAGVAIIDHQGVLSLGQAPEWRTAVEIPEALALAEFEASAGEPMEDVVLSPVAKGQQQPAPQSPLSMSAAKAAA